MIVLKNVDTSILDEKLASFRKIEVEYQKAQRELEIELKNAQAEYYGHENGIYGYYGNIKETITLDSGVIIKRHEWQVNAEIQVAIGTLKAFDTLYDPQDSMPTTYSIYGNNGKIYDGKTKKYYKERKILDDAINMYKVFNPFKTYDNLRLVQDFKL